MWQFIRKSRQAQIATKFSDVEIVAHVLNRRDWTAARRVVGPAFCAGVRRQQLLLVADEVMKSVAYALMTNTPTLGVVFDNQFVLEVPENEASLDFLKRVGRLAVDAARDILGVGAPSCSCELRARW